MGLVGGALVKPRDRSHLAAMQGRGVRENRAVAVERVAGVEYAVRDNMLEQGNGEVLESCEVRGPRMVTKPWVRVPQV